MAAQIGSSILLEYGPQGSRQSGNSILLQAEVPVAARRTLTASIGSSWAPSADCVATMSVPYGSITIGDVKTQAPWALGSTLDEQKDSRWVPSTPTDDARQSSWGRYAGRLQPESGSRWVASRAVDDASAAPWGRYERYVDEERDGPWSASARRDQSSGMPWLGPLAELDLVRHAPYARSRAADRVQWAPWTRFSRSLLPNWGIPIPPDDGAPGAFIVVPIRSVYMQVNTTALRRVDGNISLPALSVRLSLDMDSWVWSFSASLPADTLELVLPDASGEPRELEATINGKSYRLLAERIQRERSFGKEAIGVSGRGKTALLDAPYAPVLNFANSEARTMEQLMNDVLTDNGVPLGWTVDFGPEDWQVPAGVWSHRGSYMSALNTLAAAAGAYIQPHATDDALSVLLKYPAAPWEWASRDVDIELPSAPVTRESMEWVDKPRYNRVYVSGAQQGVLGQVTRAGTAGDLVAPMIVDPLITAPAAARQRGLPVLADVGRIVNTSLRFPVLPETGVVTPGKFVRYVDGAVSRVGLVRGVSVDVARPQVWQTITLETHVAP